MADRLVISQNQLVMIKIALREKYKTCGEPEYKDLYKELDKIGYVSDCSFEEWKDKEFELIKVQR